MRNKPSVQARCPEYQRLLKQKQVGPIGLAVALRFVNQFVFYEQSKPCYSARLQLPSYPVRRNTEEPVLCQTQNNRQLSS